MKERLVFFFKFLPVILLGEVTLGMLAILVLAALGADGNWGAFARAIPATIADVFWPVSLVTAAYLAVFLIRAIVGPARGGNLEPLAPGSRINPATGSLMTSEYGFDVGGFPYGFGPDAEER